MEAKIVTLPGDGIGTEIVTEGIRVLEAVAEKHGHTFTFEAGLIGGCAIDEMGEPFPDKMLALCRQADGVLLGAVGGPQWSDPSAPMRPEAGVMKLRKGLALYANLRPVHLYSSLIEASTIKPEAIRNVDLVFVRELTGGIYFGARQDAETEDGVAFDTMTYAGEEVQRVTHKAFQLARQRRSKVTSVDKANVLASSRLWRRVVTEVGKEYPDVELEHLLVDAMAMYLLRRPGDFDVVLTANLFGDILTDEASMLAGSVGMLPSASLGSGINGVYEPIHGSAPDIAGQGIANPLGTILSAGMLLRYSLGLEQEADAVERAVQTVLDQGYRTPDIAGDAVCTVTTAQMGDVVVAALAQEDNR